MKSIKISITFFICIINICGLAQIKTKDIIPNNPNPNITAGKYYIKTSLTSRFLDVKGGNPAATTAIQIYDFNGSSAQVWELIPSGDDDYFYIKSELGRYLDVKGGSSASEIDVWLWDFNGGDAQKWRFAPSRTSLYYSILSKLGTYLDVSGGVIENGTKVWTYNNAGFIAQNWEMKALTEIIKVDLPIITDPFKKIDPSKLINPLDDFIILGDDIWIKEINTGIVLPHKVLDIFTPNIISWRATKNENDSYTIANIDDPDKVLCSDIHLTQSRQIEAVFNRANGIRSSDIHLITLMSIEYLAAQRKIENSHWVIEHIALDNYWIKNSNHYDSFNVKIIPNRNIPRNNISFNFNNLIGWDLTEGSENHAFNSQPSLVNFIPFYATPVVPHMPLGGSYWHDIENTYFSINTRTRGAYINTNRPGSDKWALTDETKTGSLVSKPFYLCNTQFNYKIGGTQDAANIKVELYQKTEISESGTVRFNDGNYKLIIPSVATGHNNDIVRQVAISLPDLRYAVCRIKITDNSTTGHILVSDINFFDNPRIINENIPINPIPPQKPIWGAIDMHTHPMSYMGMGGKLMHGQLDGDPTISLGNCKCTHGGWGLENQCGNYLRAEIVNMVDEHNKANQFRYDPINAKVPHNDHNHVGYPALINWPKQSSMIHQQMWYEWLQRANKGGLKAIIALTINSEILAKVLGGDGETDDRSTADRQISEITAFVARHTDFLGIAHNPSEMRDIINSGKMAIIIGMEIDHIGNFYANATVTKSMIIEEIESLKRRGVSYIFPIHIVDNKFGGSAAYKELFNYSNKYATGQPISGSNSAFTLPPILPGNLMNVEQAPDNRIGFRFSPTLSATQRIVAKALLEIIEMGGIPPLPPIPIPDPIVQTAWLSSNTTIATANIVVAPVLFGLKASSQYQLLKKYYLDPHPEAAQYSSVAPGHRNILGLTDIGKFAINELMRQGMMIDMDHASEKSVNDIIRIAVQNDYPVNAGHNSLRAIENDVEKTRTRKQLDTIKITGGMFGIGWENQTPTDFNSIYTNHLVAMGNKNTTFGSDIDGYAATPIKPTSTAKFVNYTDGIPTLDLLTKCSMALPSTRVWNYNTEGLAHIGLVPDFFEALKKDGMIISSLNQLFLSAEYFAQMWEKCERRAPLIPRD